MNQRRDDARIDQLITIANMIKWLTAFAIPCVISFGVWLNVNIADIRLNMAVLTEKERNEIIAIQRRLDKLEFGKFARD